MPQASSEALVSTPGKYTILLVLVAVSIAGWSVYDARRRGNERALAAGVGLLFGLLLVYTPGYYLVARSGLGSDLVLWVGIVLVSVAVISFGAGYWVYADATERGSENPAAWGLVVGGSMATGTVLGIVLLLIYISNRE